MSETTPAKGKGQGVSVGARFNPFRLFTGIFIPNALVRNPSISPSAKIVWGRLAQYAGEDGDCYPSQELLAAEVGVSTRHIKRLLMELEAARFIEKEVATGIDRLQHKTARYYFLWHDCFTSGGDIYVPSGGGVSVPSFIIERESVVRESVKQVEGTSHPKEIVKEAVTKALVKANDTTLVATAVIADLNDRLRALNPGKHLSGYKVTPKVLELVRARLGEGFEPEDFRIVNANMITRWGHDSKMRQFIRPMTLYSNKMDGYLNTPPGLHDKGMVSEKTEKSAAIAKEWLAEKGGHDAGTDHT